MKVRVLKTKYEILDIKNSWTSLFNNGNYSIFQSFEYCFTSIRNSSKPFIIIIINDNSIVEIWPLEWLKKKLRFINSKHADYCDILSRTNSNLVSEYLSENRLTIHLSNLKHNSLLFSKRFSQKRLKLKSSQYSILKLDATKNFPDNFTFFVHRKRRRLKRILKKYSTVHKIYTVDHFDFPIEKVNNLRDLMITTGIRNKDFLSPNTLSLFKTLYEIRKAMVSCVEIDNKTCAISFIFKKNNEYSFWIDLFDDKQMINLYHNTLFIKYITENSTAVFDFGRGLYNYKIQNFEPNVCSLYTFITFSNQLERLLFILKDRVKIFLKFVYKKIKL